MHSLLSLYRRSLVLYPSFIYFFFFFNDTATTEIYTLSLHDALPIWDRQPEQGPDRQQPPREAPPARLIDRRRPEREGGDRRSEEHTSELQSRQYLVCRLLLEKKKKNIKNKNNRITIIKKEKYERTER